MLALGTKAPDFTLPDTVSGEEKSLNNLVGTHGVVIAFICNHCPYVIHVQDEMVRIAKEYQQQGISFIAISSNEIENYPQDAPELMKELALKLDFNFPYLYDESQEVAKAYKAECTPDFFVFDKAQELVYRGRMDGSSPGNGVPNTGEDLRNALNQLLVGDPIEADQKPSMGCNIKWKN